MEKQILDLLLNLTNKMNNLESDISEIKAEQKSLHNDISEIRVDQKSLHKSINELKSDMNDRFGVVEIKLNAIETKIIKVDKKLNSTTEQVTRNIESIEDIKFNLQH